MRSVQPPPPQPTPVARVGLLVTGSRTWRWPDVANAVLRWPDGPVTLIHGGARGADRQMARHAADQGWEVLPAYRPDYGRYSPQVAPLKRNEAMVFKLSAMWVNGEIEVPICVALWRNHSSGTEYTLDLARKAGFTVITRYDCGCHDVMGATR